MALRRRQRGGLGQFQVGGPRMALQMLEDAAVDSIQIKVIQVRLPFSGFDAMQFRVPGFTRCTYET
jgi:hypothetical protein